MLVALIGAAFALCLAGTAHALSVQELARLEGQGESDLWGLGFVTGLGGTGDPASTAPAARQLARLLQNGGNPIPNVEELARGKNIAMVMVTCKAPREGARRGDKLDVMVTSWHNAKSLQGGQLFLTPLQGPLPGQGVYASASGPLVFEGDSITTARVRAGATITHDIMMPVIARDGSITLVVEPAYAGWSTAQLIASAINSERQGLEETSVELARAMDDRTVRVLIPEAELPDPANFIANVMSIRLDPSLLSMPAKVIVNERNGTIVVTGDVQISPVVITHRDLVITTINPPLEPTPESPVVTRSRWTSLATEGNDRDQTRVQDLLEALKQLDVPVSDQIAILAKLHKIGRLHGEYIVE